MERSSFSRCKLQCTRQRYDRQRPHAAALMGLDAPGTTLTDRFKEQMLLINWHFRLRNEGKCPLREFRRSWRSVLIAWRRKYVAFIRQLKSTRRPSPHRSPFAKYFWVCGTKIVLRNTVAYLGLRAATPQRQIAAATPEAAIGRVSYRSRTGWPTSSRPRR
jgi:hypothetical protein